MIVLVQIRVISMNRLRKGDSAMAKQWLQCSLLGRSDQLANEGAVKAKLQLFCVKICFSSVEL